MSTPRGRRHSHERHSRERDRERESSSPDPLQLTSASSSVFPTHVHRSAPTTTTLAGHGGSGFNPHKRRKTTHGDVATRLWAESSEREGDAGSADELAAAEMDVDVGSRNRSSTTSYPEDADEARAFDIPARTEDDMGLDGQDKDLTPEEATQATPMARKPDVESENPIKPDVLLEESGVEQKFESAATNADDSPDAGPMQVPTAIIAEAAHSDPPAFPIASVISSPTPPPPSTSEPVPSVQLKHKPIHKPLRATPAPRPKQGTSSRTQMNALMNARYNEKGEIILSDEDAEEKAVEEFMRRTGGSIDVDGKVVPTVEDSDLSGLEHVVPGSDGPVLKVEDEPGIPEANGDLPVHPMVHCPPASDSMSTVSRLKKEKKKPLNSGSISLGLGPLGPTRQALDMLFKAKYNEKGEMIVDDPAVHPDEARPQKKQKMFSGDAASGTVPKTAGTAKGKGKGKNRLPDGPGSATPAYTDSAYDAEGTPFTAVLTEDTGSIVDPGERVWEVDREDSGLPVSKRAGGLKGKKNALSNQGVSASSGRVGKKGSEKIERDDSLVPIDSTPERPKKGGKKVTTHSNATPPRSASINSSLPEKEEAPLPFTKRRKQKEEFAILERDEDAEAVEQEMEDETIYCVCRKKFREDSSDMVECDLCQNWYHFHCMKLDETRSALIEQYVCPQCEKDPRITERTSWKIKCLRGDCKQPDRVPLSKYCSDVCGIHETLARLESKGIDISHVWETVRAAPKPEGVCIEVKPVVIGDEINGNADAMNPVKRREGLHMDASHAKARARAEGELREHALAQTRLEERIRELERRETALTLAISVAEALPPLTRQSERDQENGGIDHPSAADSVGRGSRPGKKGKSVSGVGANVEERPCGFDFGLVDLIGETGGLCMRGRKRCERHVGWQKLRGADLELERANLSTDLERIGRRIAVARERHVGFLEAGSAKAEIGE